jgi:hypothetical protein
MFLVQCEPLNRKLYFEEVTSVNVIHVFYFLSWESQELNLFSIFTAVHDTADVVLISNGAPESGW